MSTQPFSPLPESPTNLTAKDAEDAKESWEKPQSQNQPAVPPAPYRDPFEVRTDGPTARPWPDEPWRVKIWSEADEARERATPQLKVARWRAGDLARLKEDTPHGVIKYVATHDEGFWGQMAAKLLKDADRLEQMVKEVVPYGTVWHVDTDLEKLKQIKEERETQRAKEDAERQEFVEKQHEKLKKAGEAPRCEHVYVDGRGCRGPQMRGERWCYNHKQMMTYRPGELAMAPLEDENALMLNILQVQRALITGRLTEKTAALLLYSMAIAAPSVAKVHKPGDSPQSTQREIGEEENLKTTEGTEETQEGKSPGDSPQSTQRTQREIGEEENLKTTGGTVGEVVNLESVSEATRCNGASRIFGEASGELAGEGPASSELSALFLGRGGTSPQGHGQG